MSALTYPPRSRQLLVIKRKRTDSTSCEHVSLSARDGGGDIFASFSVNEDGGGAKKKRRRFVKVDTVYTAGEIGSGGAST